MWCRRNKTFGTATPLHFQETHWIYFPLVRHKLKQRRIVCVSVHESVCFIPPTQQFSCVHKSQASKSRFPTRANWTRLAFGSRVNVHPFLHLNRDLPGLLRGIRDYPHTLLISSALSASHRLFFFPFFQCLFDIMTIVVTCSSS